MTETLIITNYSANNFDTRTLKAKHKAKRWIVLLQGFSSTVYCILEISCNLRWNLNTSDLNLYLKYNHHHNHHHNHHNHHHNPNKNHAQQNSRNWRFVLWSITSPLPSSWSAMSQGAGLRGPNLGTWRCPKFPKFRAWDMAGLIQNGSNTVSSKILDWPQMRF